MLKNYPWGGASINRSPLFCGLNYRFWKVRMKFFVELIDRGIWDTNVNGPFVPKFEKKIMVSLKNLGPNGLRVKVKELNMIAFPRTSSLLLWILMNFLGSHNVHLQRRCWTSLSLPMKVRKHALIQEYEMFRMRNGETIMDVQKRFTYIVNHLISLGKIFEREKLNIKISNAWIDLGNQRSLQFLNPRIWPHWPQPSCLVI